MFMPDKKLQKQLNHFRGVGLDDQGVGLDIFEAPHFEILHVKYAFSSGA